MALVTVYTSLNGVESAHRADLARRVVTAFKLCTKADVEDIHIIFPTLEASFCGSAFFSKPSPPKAPSQPTPPVPETAAGAKLSRPEPPAVLRITLSLPAGPIYEAVGVKDALLNRINGEIDTWLSSLMMLLGEGVTLEVRPVVEVRYIPWEHWSLDGTIVARPYEGM